MKKLFPFVLLLATVVFAVFIHFTYLDGGLPNSRKTEQVIGNKAEMEKWIPRMIEQRREYYAMVDKLMDKNQPFKESYDNLSHRWDVAHFSTLPQDLVLDRLRNYLIGVDVSDEQHVMNAVSGLNPQKLDFIPGPLRHYGGVYYYTCGAFLMFGKIMHWISLNSNVEYYFYHPEEISAMYHLVRAVGAAAAVCAVALLFFMLRRLYGTSLALLSAVFLAVTPLLVIYSHLCKAHLSGMFWAAAGLCVCGLILKGKKSFLNYCLAGLCLGLTAGTIITNLSFAIVILFTEMILQDWSVVKTLKNPRVWLAMGIFFLTYGITNFYVFLEYSKFSRLVQSMITYYPAYVKVGLGDWLPYLKNFCAEQFHWTLIPLLIAGMIFSVTRREKFMLLCLLSFLVLFGQNLVFLRHPPVNARIVPLAVILAAWGALELLRGSSSWKKVLLSAYIGLAIAASGVQCWVYLQQHRVPSNVVLAGSWINENISAGSSFGVWGGGFAPVEFPPFQFLKYKLVSIPHLSELNAMSVDVKKMPKYLIYSSKLVHGVYQFPASLLLENNYHPVQEWMPDHPGLQKYFGTDIMLTGNWGLTILEKN